MAATSGRTYATLTWTTTELADSQVEYGLTTSYGASSPLEATLVAAHSVTLSGLQANMLHHYRVRSRDASGNLAVSADNTFTTLASTAPTGVKVAFIGDQGLGTDARAVLQLIKNEGAAVVLHQGDFDYLDDPNAWDLQINGVLGSNFPYFASIGNHDAFAWPGYQQKLKDRLGRLTNASCSGDLGVQSTCIYKGLLMVFTAPGERGTGHDAYIRDQLAQSNFPWRISSWHKNQRLMQVARIDQKAVAERMKKAPSTISERLALLSLPKDVQAQVAQRKLSIKAALEVGKVANDKRRARLTAKADRMALDELRQTVQQILEKARQGRKQRLAEEQKRDAGG